MKKPTEIEDDLIKMKVVLEKLKEDGIVEVSKQAFYESVKRGTMPHHKPKGSKFKLYDYSTVVYCIKSGGMFGYTAGGLNTEEEADLEQRFKDNPTLTDANILKTIVTTKREKAKLAEEEGKVIAREVVEDKAFTVARIIRDKILSIPERMANELASIDNPHVIKELLYKEFGVLLEGLSKESFYD